jgi:hypothetical protein
MRELMPGRLPAMLESIEKIIIEECGDGESMRVVSGWLSELLKRNMGHIINSP